MEEDPHKNGLYRWQRQTKPKLQSRSHRLTSSNDIQDWIKKVEEASVKATDAAFGLSAPTGVSGKQRGKMAAQLRSEQVRNQESAYSEAQQLLSQWVTEKVRFDDDNDGFDDLEAWRRARENRQAAMKSNTAEDSQDFSLERLTRLAVEDDYEIDEAAIYERVKRSAIGDTDPYANLYEMEVPDAVDSVLKNMLSKEVVKDSFKKKIGMDEEAPPNPVTKMELRHQMVKENREKRQREEENRRHEAKMRKEARLAAQKLIMKEQKDREARAKHEDQQLRKDMARIRKEMHDDRRKREDDMKRKREEKEAMDRLAREELERQNKVEWREKMETHRHESDRRKKQLVQREMLSAKIASLNLQCMHRHFTAWYDLVLSRRLLQGKVKAMADWKLMLRVWGAWRSHVRGRRLEVETEMHERSIIEAERHKLKADRHFSHSILRRCMLAWQRFAVESAQRKELEAEQQRTKSKMAALLSAVAEGKLGGTDKGDDSSRSVSSAQDSAAGVSARSTQSAKSRQKIAQNLQHQAKKQAGSRSNYDETAQSDTSNNYSPSQESNNGSNAVSGNQKARPSSRHGVHVPTEAWQVSRQHLNLTKQQMAEMAGQWEERVDERGPHSATLKKKHSLQPWMNRQFVPPNFEHRYTAQQAALKEQQAQIREQRRLIEELQYEQRQQALRQRLLPGSNTPPPLPPPLLETEVPSQGKQIPRDEEEDSDVGTPHSNSSAINEHHRHGHDNSGSHAVGPGTSHHAGMRTPPTPTNSLQAQHNGYTDSNGAITDRTDFSSATRTTTATSATGTTHNAKYLKVLKNMEERAAERARLKAEREERRRIQEEEKAAQLLKEEEERQKEIEAEKKAKIEAYRQKKRLEKQREEEKQRQLARQEETTQMADAHYRRAILKYRGLLPFKKLISLAKRNWLKAVRQEERSSLRICLQAWKQYTEEEMESKNKLADQMHQFILTKRCFLNWRHYKYHQHFLERRAERHHRDVLKSRVFQAWAGAVEEEKREMSRLMSEAGETYLRNLVKKSFLGWRDLPQKLKREEERQKRKSELRKRVSELIPDFTPTQQASVNILGSEELS